VHFMFLALVVMNLVGGFHALGTLLAVGLMMLPAAGARLWTQDVTRLLIVSVLAGMASGYFGLLASYHFEVPAGPSIILAAGGFYLVSLAFGRDGGFLRRLLPARHLEA
jgi:zinc/manganese transport system permease protein